MNRIYLASMCLFLLISTSFAGPQIENKIKHVIYITLDGVRWQDIYLSKAPFKILWTKYAKELTFYGAPGSPETIEVASIPISLPSYQSQMSGKVQPCDGNGCGRIQVETFPENLVNHVGFAKKDVVTFSSWWTIANAVEHEYGTTFANTGNMPVYDPETNRADLVMAKLNFEQFLYHPLSGRYDRYTFAQALHYFEKYQPRFMWISVDEADEAAHLAWLQGYYQALDLYDKALDKLFTLLKTTGLDQETMVIVTTDHGRGDGKNWTSHGPEFPESKQTWAFTMNGSLLPVDAKKTRYSTLSIRPTVEKILGVTL